MRDVSCLGCDKQTCPNKMSPLLDFKHFYILTP